MQTTYPANIWAEAGDEKPCINRQTCIDRDGEVEEESKNSKSKCRMSAILKMDRDLDISNSLITHCSESLQSEWMKLGGPLGAIWHVTAIL
jgi:hypothetical protein